MSTEFKQLLSELEAIRGVDRLATNNIVPPSSALIADFFETLPFPAWIKVLDRTGKLKMAYVNAAYENHIGITVAEYFAKEDSEVGWTTAELEEFEANDRKAIDSRAIIQTAETARNVHGMDSVWKGHKWPIIRNDGVVAVCAYALLPVIKED